MAHVSFCITGLHGGGAERALVRIATGLAHAGWRVDVVALTDGGPLVAESRRNGIDVRTLGMRRRFPFPAAAALAGQWRRDRPDIVQTFLFHANLVGRLAAKRAGVGTVCSGLRVAERRRGPRLWLDRVTDSLVDAHVAVSESVARDAITRGGLPAEKVVVIPNGVDADRFAQAEPLERSEIGLPHEARVTLWAGRLDPQKDPELAVAAFAEFARSRPEEHLVMAGDGPLRSRVVASVAASGVADRIRLVGRRDDLPRLYRAADRFLLTSRWEGMPNVLLEALAAGLPVVSTLAEGVEEVLGKRGERGTIVRTRNSADIADGLAASDKESARSSDTERYVRSHHDWPAVVAAYAGLYGQLLAGEPART